MSYTHTELKVVNILSSQISMLMFYFCEIEVKTEDGEIIFLDGVSNHNAYYDPRWINTFEHHFETTVRRKGHPLQSHAKVDLVSTDTEIFSGTIRYDEEYPDGMSE